MEGFGTYNAIQEIAELAVKEYQEKLFKTEDPHSYAVNVLNLYRSSSALNPIKDNVYHRHLVESYSETVKREIIRRINKGALDE